MHDEGARAVKLALFLCVLCGCCISSAPSAVKSQFRTFL